jgi:ABC-type multidrug transport system ATPase subunit
MDQPIIRQIIRLVAIRLCGLRGAKTGTAIEPLLRYFRSMHHEVSKSEINTVIHECSQRLKEPGLTAEHLINEAIAEIKKSLEHKDQLQLLLMILDLANQSESIQEILRPEKLAASFGISEDEANRFRLFMTAQEPVAGDISDCLVFTSTQTDTTDKLEGRWIEDRQQARQDEDNYLEIENFKGKLLVLYLKPIQSFVVRCTGKEGLEVDGIKLTDCRFRILGAGSSISFNEKAVLTFSEIKQRYLQHYSKRAISLSINNLQLSQAHSENPIHSLTIKELSGSLIGILGKEGAGKTTLLKLLAGHIAPDKGHIEINGYDLQKNRYLLKDIIGHVPEEDMMFEELTVYDNLLMYARLYYSSLSTHAIRHKVDQLLRSLLLNDIRDTVVGNVLNKKIQPGQRRILNIALEILREPQILLVDNALSGLSMSDSAKVIKILHQYTLEGNLVITSITQVNSRIFNYFDKVWILDDGGYPVYTGPTHKAAAYLSKRLDQSEKMTEEVDPAMLIDLINQSHERSEHAESTRLLSPEEWHQHYLTSRKPDTPEPLRKSIFPVRPIKIPNLEVQFMIFSLRNFLCKFSKIDNLVLTLLSGPLIALIIGFFLRKGAGDTYSYESNFNLPAYQFISIMVAMFMGIVISSGEILKERNIIHKEHFLAFSRFSYINSKIIFLVLIVALQSFLYTAIGNTILEIKGMTGSYWIVFFSAATFGVLTGLLFSSVVSKLSVIDQKLVPIFLAFQVLFGGGIISYQALNLEKTKYVPFLGELAVSRWGYEAIAVQQYSRNLYEKNFFALDKDINRSEYYITQLLPELSMMTEKSMEGNAQDDSLIRYRKIIYNELDAIASEPEVFPFEFLESLKKEDISPALLAETSDYITYLRLHFQEKHEAILAKRKQLVSKLVDSLGQDEFNRLKNDYFNIKLEELVTNHRYGKQIELIGDRFIRFGDGIYQTPVSNYGRAVMFTPSKIFNGQEMATLWFNVSIIWMFSSFIYLLLLTDAINFFRRNINA